jgi:hypothetical protein
MIYERDGDLLKHSLSSLGIPPLDIVKVGSDDKMGFFLLAQSGSCELGLNIKS